MYMMGAIGGMISLKDKEESVLWRKIGVKLACEDDQDVDDMVSELKKETQEYVTPIIENWKGFEAHYIKFIEAMKRYDKYAIELAEHFGHNKDDRPIRIISSLTNAYFIGGESKYITEMINKM